MKALLITLILLPFYISSIEIDEEKFHEIITDEVIFSAKKSYDLLTKEEPTNLIFLMICWEAGYQKGLVTAESVLDDCLNSKEQLE